MSEAKKSAFVLEYENRMKREKAKGLRYKKPLALGLNMNDIRNRLFDMQSECEECQMFIEDEGFEFLYMVFDSDEEEIYEFKMAFADLSANLSKFSTDLDDLDRFGWDWEADNDSGDELFDLLMVGSVSTGDLMGYDSYEEDYYGLDRFEGKLAQDAAQKNLMRLTKKDMITAFSKSAAILISWLGLCYRYDCLKASMDILRDQNQSIIKVVKKIEELYEAAIDGDTMFSDGYKIKREWEQLLDALPPETWLA